MRGKSEKMPMEEAKKLLSGADGQKLMALMMRDGGVTMRQVVEALQKGDTERAKALLQPFLQQQDTAGLLQRMKAGEKNGRSGG